MRVVMSVLCSHCKSIHVERIIRRGLRDMVQNSLGKWPYICRSCQKRTYSKHRRNSPNKASEGSMPDSSVRSAVDCTARRQGADAAVMIRAESEHQLTNILLALSRAIEAAQMTSQSMKQNSRASEAYSHNRAPYPVMNRLAFPASTFDEPATVRRSIGAHLPEPKLHKPQNVYTAASARI
jgi:hypothetical protein